MVRIGFIVEGGSEKVIVESKQFRDWLHQNGIELVFPVIDAKGGGNLLPKNIEPLVGRFRSLGVDHICVLTDLEEEPNAQTVKNRIENSNVSFVFVAVKALEGWYLADTEAMNKWLKESDFYEEFPELTHSKPWDRLKEIAQNLNRTGPGNKISFAKKMVKYFNFQISSSAQHNNCDSAKELIRELRSIGNSNSKH